MISRKWFDAQRFGWQEFCILFALGVIANLYFLTNYSPSIDDELSAVRATPTVWIAQGRFTIFLIESSLFPQPALPYSPYLFLAATLACTHMLLLRAHGILPSWSSYLAYGIFITYPTWWMIEEFAANVPATGIGFLLVAGALSLQSTETAESRVGLGSVRWGCVAVIGLLLALAAGAYQTLLLFYAAATLGVVTLQTQRANVPDWKLLRDRLFYGLFCLVVGAVLYFAINKAALITAGIAPEYIAGFVNFENLKAPRWLIGAIVVWAWHMYAGASSVFGAAMPSAILTLVAALIAIVLTKRRQTYIVAGLFLAVLGTPFALNILTGPDGLPLRSMVAVPYVIWLCIIITLEFVPRALQIISVACFMVFQLQILNLNSQYMAAASVVQQQDRMMAFEVGKRIHSLRGDGDASELIFLDTFGYTEKYRSSIYAVAESSVTKGSFFGWDQGNLKRISAYLRLTGFDRVRAVPDDVRRTLAPEFDNMPVWPAEGSIQRTGKYYLLKLSSKPDKFHRAE